LLRAPAHAAMHASAPRSDPSERPEARMLPSERARLPLTMFSHHSSGQVKPRPLAATRWASVPGWAPRAERTVTPSLMPRRARRSGGALMWTWTCGDTVKRISSTASHSSNASHSTDWYCAFPFDLIVSTVKKIPSRTKKGRSFHMSTCGIASRPVAPIRLTLYAMPAVR